MTTLPNFLVNQWDDLKDSLGIPIDLSDSPYLLSAIIFFVTFYIFFLIPKFYIVLKGLGKFEDESPSASYVKTDSFAKRIESIRKHTHPDKYANLPMLSLEKLAEFDGKDDSKPVYVGAKGLVFDVTSRKHMYAPGTNYNCFAGRDASRRLALSDVENPQDNKIGVADLDADEIASLDHWFNFYQKKYPVVARYPFSESQ